MRCRRRLATGHRIDDHPGLLPQMAPRQLCRIGGAGARRHHAAAVGQARTGYLIPTCSAGREGPARPPPPASSPRRRTAWTCRTATRATSAPSARRSTTAASWTSSNWTPRATGASTRSGTSGTKLTISPAQGSRKVYIIDEAHMLTDAAANAFLKTLEEPPGHVIFILCTTEAHKIIPTIVSRCQRFDFRRIPSGAYLRPFEGDGRFRRRRSGGRRFAIGGPLRRRQPTGTPKTCWNSWCFPPPTVSA